MSFGRGETQYGAARKNAEEGKHTAGPRSVGGLQQTNCPKTGKPEHVTQEWTGKFKCDGCRAEIPFDAIGNR